jgi:hypothetical protein
MATFLDHSEPDLPRQCSFTIDLLTDETLEADDLSRKF